MTIIDALNLQDIELDTRIVRERCSELMREEERKEIARKRLQKEIDEMKRRNGRKEGQWCGVVWCVR